MDGVTYHAHLEFLVKQERGARAERYGFVDAKGPITMPMGFDSEYEMMRYQQGFEDGTVMLSVQEAS